MDRRKAAVWTAWALLAGCGGGGGDSGGSESTVVAGGPPPGPAPSPTPAPPAPAPAPAPSALPQSANIAMWGDSLTVPVAANLQVLMPDRTVYNGGVVGETSSQIAARQLADAGAHGGWINVFWYGQNNDSDPATIAADIAASIARLAPGNDRFLVLSVVNKARWDEVPGTPAYATIIGFNRQLAATYGGHYFDMRAWLVSQYDPQNPQDVQDAANDEVPSSLRFDEIHFNNNGSVKAATRLRELILALGW